MDVLNKCCQPLPLVILCGATNNGVNDAEIMWGGYAGFEG